MTIGHTATITEAASKPVSEFLLIPFGAVKQEPDDGKAGEPAMVTH